MNQREPDSLSRRTFLQCSGLVLGGLAAATTIDGFPTIVRAARPKVQDVSLILGWLANSQQAGEYVALEQGYFRDEGINLKIQPGGPNVNSVQLVAGGAAMLGQTSSSPSMILARSQGIPIKAFASALQKHPFAYFSLKKSGIQSPQDFVGKKIGIQATSRPLIDAVLAKYHIPESQVQIITIGSDLTPLVDGQVDVASAWVIDKAQIAALPEHGYNVMLLWNMGIRLYANPYFAKEAVVSSNAKLLSGFVRAAARGWSEAYAQPSKAIDAVMRSVPNLDRASELATLKAMKPFMWDETTSKHGWGWMNTSVWQSDINIYASLKQIPQRFPASEVATLSILMMTKGRPTH
jgi:NitT/TauT family transport system substrate-binding protein